MTTQTIFVPANGLEFEVLTAGEGDKLALCLHGFPEHAISWRFQMAPLAAAGWRVWAPNQRGYGATTLPKNREAYGLDNLTGDVAALIDASGAKKVALIGHDWGALVAWVFAARKIRPLDRLAILNVPHPSCFKRELRTNPRQKRKSRYVSFFRIPWLPDYLLSRAGGAAVARMLTTTTRNPRTFSQESLRIFAANAARPGGMTGMLNWYRVAGRDLARARDLDTKIEIPTLVIWGEQDVALDLACLEGTPRYVDDLCIERLPEASHWVQQDAPDKVNALLTRFLANA